MRVNGEWGAVYHLPVHGRTRLAVPGDLHFGAEDRGSIDAFMTAAEDWGVTDFVGNGDVFDAYGISGYKKEAQRSYESGRLLDETRAARPVLERVIRLVKRTAARLQLAPGKVVVNPGNHEGARAETFVDNNPALAGMTYVDLWGLQEFERDIEFLTYGMAVKAGSLIIEHGDKAPGAEKGGAGAATKVLAALPDQNTLIGHTHRVESAFRETYRDGVARQHGCWVNGHFQNPAKATYKGRRSGGWQQGGAFVEYYPTDGDDPTELQFEVHLVRVVNRRIRFNGRTYKCG